MLSFLESLHQTVEERSGLEKPFHKRRQHYRAYNTGVDNLDPMLAGHQAFGTKTECAYVFERPLQIGYCCHLFRYLFSNISNVVYFEVQVKKIRICLWTKIDCCCVASVYARMRVLGGMTGSCMKRDFWDDEIALRM